MRSIEQPVDPLFEDTDAAEKIAEALRQTQTSLRNIALKALYYDWIEQIRQNLSNRPALLLCQSLSDCMDILVGQLAQELLQHNQNTIAIVALGGYGRRELYPHSDIDLLILSTVRRPATLQPALEKLLYTLWDLGLKVGHSIQSIKSARTLAKNDSLFATSILESRLLHGDEAVYRLFCVERDALFAQKEFVRHFLTIKQSEKLLRHEQHNDQRTMLEPNLKEGIGALRDLQQIRWMTLATQTVHPTPLLSASEQILWQRLYRRFARLRLALHFESGGENNRLYHHHQLRLSEYLGFRTHHILHPIERLMKLFFLLRYETEFLAQIVTARLIGESLLPQPTEHRYQEPLPKPYYWHQDMIERNNAFDCVEDVLEYFLLLKQHHGTPGARGLSALRNARRLCKTPSHTARILLRRLLCASSNGDYFPNIAQLLVRSRVLAQMLPDFAHIQGLSQFDGYHAWTVDRHTLMVLGHLHSMSEPRPDSAHELADLLMTRHGTPEVVFFAALLHDIAKGRGGQHPERGGEVAETLAPQFGFGTGETQIIAWLIRQHLLLSSLALHRDILDPGTAKALCDAVPDAQYLDLLYCLTNADIRSVAPNSWTAWKATVITRLFDRAQHLLQPLPSAKDRAELKSAAISTLWAALPDMSERTFARHIQHCSGEYLRSTELALQIEHARMMSKIAPLASRECRITLLPDPEDAIVRLVLYTGDYSGLIAHTVGVLTEAGYSIVTLKIFPYGEQHSLMTVWFHDQGKALQEERRLVNLKNKLESVIQARFIKFHKPSLRKPAQTLQIITNKVAIDNTVSPRATVIEIQTRNRRGLLFDLVVALNAERVNIHAAKIDTVGQRVMDVFYVCDRFGLKVSNPVHLERIRTSLKRQIS